jgi:L-glyceraldehyde 3-phosphate reductase
LLKDTRVTTVLIGASRVEQLLDSLKAVENKNFDASELEQIEKILAQ